MAIIGILMGVVGFLGSVFYGFGLIFGLLGIAESKIAKNGATNYHKKETKTTLKMLGIFFGIFVLGLLITYLGTLNQR